MIRLWENILLLFCICFFCNAARADGLDLFSHLYLSNKKYAKNIEVHAYLITKDQVAKLFSEENAEVIQKTNKELYSQEVYLLVRYRNLGDSKFFGILNCKFPNSGPISIEIMKMPTYMKSFYDSVLYIGDGLIPNDNGTPNIIPNDNGTPNISYEWKSLYTM